MTEKNRRDVAEGVGGLTINYRLILNGFCNTVIRRNIRTWQSHGSIIESPITWRTAQLDNRMS